jgi:hypothetical protein
MSSYHYRGKRYQKRPSVWKAVRKVASSVYHATEGVHLKGGRDPEHYIRQAMPKEERELDKGLEQALAEKEADKGDAPKGGA